MCVVCVCACWGGRSVCGGGIVISRLQLVGMGDLRECTLGPISNTKPRESAGTSPRLLHSRAQSWTTPTSAACTAAARHPWGNAHTQHTHSHQHQPRHHCCFMRPTLQATLNLHAWLHAHNSRITGAPSWRRPEILRLGVQMYWNAGWFYLHTVNVPQLIPG